MIRYNKMSQNAISAMSYLAEKYDGGKSIVSSLEIADARQLSKPLVAKLLTTLSQTGLVKGATGPRGGYSLAKKPKEIRLLDVVSAFEKTDDQTTCPFGPNWCGQGDPCPLHDSLTKLDDVMMSFLSKTRFSVFQKKTSPKKKTAANGS